jgi:hypothetical protein
VYGSGGKGLGVVAGAGGLGAGMAKTGFPIVGLALVGLAAVVVGLALVRLADRRVGAVVSLRYRRRRFTLFRVAQGGGTAPATSRWPRPTALLPDRRHRDLPSGGAAPEGRSAIGGPT